MRAKAQTQNSIVFGSRSFRTILVYVVRLRVLFLTELWRILSYRIWCRVFRWKFDVSEQHITFFFMVKMQMKHAACSLLVAYLVYSALKVVAVGSSATRSHGVTSKSIVVFAFRVITRLHSCYIWMTTRCSGVFKKLNKRSRNCEADECLSEWQGLSE